MTNTATPKPPRDLRRSGRALWRAVHREYELEAYERPILAEACRTVDLIDRLRAVLDDTEGVTDQSSQGVRVRPVVVELRQQRLCLQKLLSCLRAPSDEDKSEGRTQYRGIRGVYTFGAAS